MYYLRDIFDGYDGAVWQDTEHVGPQGNKLVCEGCLPVSMTCSPIENVHVGPVAGVVLQPPPVGYVILSACNFRYSSYARSTS